MMRKLLMVAAAIAMPLGTVAVASVSSVATSGVAGATTLTLTCKLPASTTTFTAPGLTDNGFTTTSAKSKEKISAGALNCGGSGTGAIPTEKIKTANTACTGTNNPITGCAAGLYVYDSAALYSTNATTLAAGFPSYTFTVGAHSYTVTNTASAAISPGGKCGAGSAGAKITGHVSAPATYSGNPAQYILCFSTDTGTNTTGNFINDVSSEISGSDSPKMTIATAGIDPTLSKIKIT